MVVSDIEMEGISSLQIKNVEIHQNVNDHAVLSMEGYINDNEITNIKKIIEEDKCLTVWGKENENKKLFVGYIYSINISHGLHDCYMKIKLISPSVQMDQIKKTRTFQNPGTSIGDIISYVCKEYGALVSFHGKDKPVDGIIVQYEETDWDFVKRLSSQLNDVVVTGVQYNNIVIDIGLQACGTPIRISTSEEMFSDEIYMIRQKKSTDLAMEQTKNFVFRTNKFYNMEDWIQTTHGAYAIYEIKTSFEAEELVHTYMCRKGAEYRVVKEKNNKIIGASLDGKVTAVSGTNVKIALIVDKNNSLCGSKNFPYATVYSSDSGTGWYCMPEVGDAVRLYFPSNREKDAYVISSVHLDVNMENDNSTSSNRSDPAIKSIANKQNKEIVFAPDKLVLTNNDSMSVVLDDEQGVTIISKLPIYLHSDSNIELNAKDSILLSAANELRIEQQPTDENGEPIEGADATAIDLADTNVTVEGTEFRIQQNS